MAYNSAGGLDATNDEVYGLWLSPSGYLQWESTPEETTNLMSVGIYILPGSYTHVVGVIDAANDRMALYINGQVVATNTYAGLGGHLRSGASPLRLGGFPFTVPGYGGLNGVIDEVRIYNRALSLSEITLLAADFGTRAPSIISQPTDAGIYHLQPVTWNVYAGGTPNLSYQWSVNGGEIPGATSANFNIASAQFTDAGTYSVVVSNAYGTATSTPFALTVLTNVPQVLQGPDSVITNAGSTVTFTISATSEVPMTYQWMFNGTAISNATASAYTIPSVQKQNCGTYACWLTNSAGSASSSGATLRVTYDRPYEIAQGIYNGNYSFCYYCYAQGNPWLGLCNITLGKKGTFTGNIFTDGDKVPFKGQFPTNTTQPSFSTNISRAKFGKSDLTIYLAMDLENWTDVINGSVYNPDAGGFGFTAYREAFGATNPATAYAGSYTIALSPLFSQGYGSATVKVNTKGKVTLSGYTGDGQAFSQNIGVSRDGNLPFYVPLYRTTHNYTDNSKNPPVAKVNNNYKVGALVGYLNFSGGNVSGWYEIFKGDTTGYSFLYPSGFSGQNGVAGSPFVKITGAASLTKTNGGFTMYSGDLNQTWSYATTVKPNNTYTFVPLNSPPNLTIAPTLAITRGTGAVTGKFTHPDLAGIKPKFKGVILQNQNSVYGCFLGTTNAGVFYDLGY